MQRTLGNLSHHRSIEEALRGHAFNDPDQSRRLRGSPRALNYLHRRKDTATLPTIKSWSKNIQSPKRA